MEQALLTTGLKVPTTCQVATPPISVEYDNTKLYMDTYNGYCCILINYTWAYIQKKLLLWYDTKSYIDKHLDSGLKSRVISWYFQGKIEIYILNPLPPPMQG